MPSEKESYVPALKYRWLDPLFDPGMRYFMREHVFKGYMVERAALRGEEWALDVGCGTGTLALLLKRSRPESAIAGLDMDPRMIDMARAKSRKSATDIALQIGTATKLPYRDGSFDLVVSSLVIHHLSREQKKDAFGEIVRVLRPGGRFLLADLGKPSTAIMRVIMFFTGLFEDLEDNVSGLLPQMLADAGFHVATDAKIFDTPFGSIWIFSAQKVLQ